MNYVTVLKFQPPNCKNQNYNCQNCTLKVYNYQNYSTLCIKCFNNFINDNGTCICEKGYYANIKGERWKS